MERSRAEQVAEGARRVLALDPAVLQDVLAPTLHLVVGVSGVDLAQVSLFDRDAQHVVCHTGVTGTVPATMARGAAPCQVVVDEQRPVWLSTTAGYPDPRAGPVSYLGVPVLGGDGSTIGALCGIAPAGRVLTSTELGQWQGFAALVSDQLELLALRAESTPERVGGPSTVTPREIRAGLEAGQFVPWYQPVIDLATGRTVGFEALARWQHPTRGLLLPADFITVAERSALIVDLDLDIWRQAVTTLAQLRGGGAPELRLAVNFSARHTEGADCSGRLAALTSAAGVPASAVDVEITETAHITAGDGVAVLSELRERGFPVLLDDFGTGWSTIASLLDLPHDGLKVDRSLTSRAHTPVGRVALGAIAAAARAQGTRTIAEGIETTQQAQAVTDLGFHHGQGYHWGRPTPDALATSLT